MQVEAWGLKERCQLSYEIKQDDRGPGAIVVFTGIVTAADVNRARQELTTNPAFVHHHYVIWDCRTAAGHTFTADQVRDFAMRAHALAEGTSRQRIALVSPPDFFRGLDRLFHVFSSVWTARLSKSFNTMDAALNWARQGKVDGSDHPNFLASRHD